MNDEHDGPRDDEQGRASDGGERHEPAGTPERSPETPARWTPPSERAGEATAWLSPGDDADADPAPPDTAVTGWAPPSSTSSAWRPSPAGAEDTPGYGRPDPGYGNRAPDHAAPRAGSTATDPFGRERPDAGADAETPTYTLSGWWPRVWASLIDAVIIAIVVGVGSSLLIGGTSIDLLADGESLTEIFDAARDGVVQDTSDVRLSTGALLTFGGLGALCSLIYSAGWMAWTNGQTFGKACLGIRVVRVSGAPVSYGWAVLRETGVKWVLGNILRASIPVLGLLAVLLDELWPLWDKEHRAVHDMIVGSRVVRVPR